MKERFTTMIGVLPIVALFLALGFAVTAFGQESPTAATNGFQIYVPGVVKAPSRYALQFDGIDDFASIVDKGDFDFRQSLTVEVWAKRLFAPPAEHLRFEGLVVGALTETPTGRPGDIRWYLIQSLVPHPHQFESSGWGMCVDTHPELCEGVFAERGLRKNEWEHVAATYDGSEMTLFLNGNAMETQEEHGNVLNASFVFLGRHQDSFNGLIDEVRVWNVARTQAQIQADMNRSLRGDEPGLVGYWRLDEGSGQAILDSSSRGNDGRLGSTNGPDGNDPTWVVSDAPVQ
jgi:hypothetical protein